MSRDRIGYSVDPKHGREDRNGRSERQRTGSGTGREAGFAPGYALQGFGRQRVSGSNMPLPAVVELLEAFVLVFIVFTGTAIAAQLSVRFVSGSDVPGATSWSRRPRAHGVEEPRAVR